MSKRSKRAVLSIGACLLLVVALAACGSNDNNTSTGSQEGAGASTQSAGTSGGAAATGANASVDQGYKGTFRQPPATGPAAQKGKNVWVISCSEALPGCARPSAAIKE